jgi:hypothetical protein
MLLVRPDQHVAWAAMGAPRPVACPGSELAETLTDAVLVPEVGQHAPAARAGFQVHFVERERDMMDIGGRLLADTDPM